MKKVFNKSWGIGRRRLYLLFSVIRALYHMFLRKYFFYRSKIVALLQTLINASQHQQKSKKLISRTCEKGFLWKLVGLSRMLPATFDHNPTQIIRCLKMLFFLANHYFHPQITGVGPVHAEKKEKKSILRTCEKGFQ